MNLHSEIKDLYSKNKDLHNSFTEVDLAVETIVKNVKKNENTIDEHKKVVSDLVTNITEKSTYTAYAKVARAHYWKSVIFGGISIAIAVGLFWYAFSSAEKVNFDASNTNQLIWEVLTRVTGITGLIFAYFFASKKSDVNSKLHSEYSYKASLAESIMGYRRLHQLAYDDEEYQLLFSKLSEQLAHNPSTTIDAYLRKDAFETIYNVRNNSIDSSNKKLNIKNKSKSNPAIQRETEQSTDDE